MFKVNENVNANIIYKKECDIYIYNLNKQKIYNYYKENSKQKYN